jgi:hypothetical protein
MQYSPLVYTGTRPLWCHLNYTTNEVVRMMWAIVHKQTGACSAGPPGMMIPVAGAADLPG